MSKKILFLLLPISMIVLTACQSTNNEVINQNNSVNTVVEKKDKQIILYYGETCPHCKVVEQYLAENKVVEKVKYTMKEVMKNQDNALELAEKAKTCNLAADQVGVPFLWDETSGQCISGDQNIIKYFKEKNK